MRRSEWLAVGGLSALAALSAVARLRAFASLSPPDLAFFHQSTWSAVQGAGFSQTALEFDAGTLFGSIHLSLVRALWVPVLALLPAVETLVALQALAVVGATAACSALCAPPNGPRTPWILLGGLSPMVLALGACDLRPLTFLVAPAVLVVAGLWRGRTLWLAAGALGVLIAREEAWMVLAALVPFALGTARAQARWAPVAVLTASVGVGLALPRLVWGHGGNISANTDLAGTLSALWAGTRPLIRWPVEWYFAARVLVAAWPALWCPELLVPALAGWAWLAVFSEMEPAAPLHGGLHYLSVVAPLVVGAALVGLSRMVQAKPSRRNALLVAASVVGVICALPELGAGLNWGRAAFTPGPLAAEVGRIRATEGGVLTQSTYAPMLSGRQILRIQGHFSPTPERVATVAEEVDHALLPAERPPEGPPAEEWDRWQDALPAAGLKIRSTVEGVVVWERAR